MLHIIASLSLKVWKRAFSFDENNWLIADEKSFQPSFSYFNHKSILIKLKTLSYRPCYLMDVAIKGFSVKLNCFRELFSNNLCVFFNSTASESIYFYSVLTQEFISIEAFLFTTGVLELKKTITHFEPQKIGKTNNNDCLGVSL